MNESPGSHHCAVARCSSAQSDVIKEDDITRRFHDKLQKAVFPSHSHSVSLSVFQVALHAASVPPHRLLHDASVSIRLWGSPVMATSNSFSISLSLFLSLTLIVHPTHIDIQFGKILFWVQSSKFVIWMQNISRNLNASWPRHLPSSLLSSATARFNPLSLSLPSRCIVGITWREKKKNPHISPDIVSTYLWRISQHI